MADKWQKEEGDGFWQLEENTDYWILEEQAEVQSPPPQLTMAPPVAPGWGNK